MESNNNNSSSLTRLVPVLIIFLGLLGLYYLYQYLFGPTSHNMFPLITATQPAQVDKELTFSTTQLAPLYEGGEFTVSTWIYLSNWSYRAGYNKSILRIGGNMSSSQPHIDTIRMYIGGNTPKLFIRLHTKNSSTDATSDGDSLDNSTYSATFNTIQTDSGLLDNSHICDIPEIPMQRWVNVVVAVNGKTVDVYIDGKLQRSCVLPNPFKVDYTGYTGYLLEKGGFAGKISTTSMYDTALNPEMVYKNYIAGPEPITTIGGLFGSFLAPNLTFSVSAGSNI